MSTQEYTSTTLIDGVRQYINKVGYPPTEVYLAPETLGKFINSLDFMVNVDGHPIKVICILPEHPDSQQPHV